ncbi:signal peptide protein, partial [Achromatium sp. WMS3]
MPKLTCIFNGRALAVHHVADGKIVIGRDADCEIQVDSLAI